MKFTSHLKAKDIETYNKLVGLVTPQTTDRSEFDAACVRFRDICKEIGSLIGVENFRGGYDEIPAFETSEHAKSIEGILLAIKWQAADNLCTYLAKKLGIGQPEWWKICWQESDEASK